MAYEYEKYVTTPEKLKETIDTYGVGIIPDVLNKEELLGMRNFHTYHPTYDSGENKIAKQKSFRS